MPIRSANWAEAQIPFIYKWFDVGRQLRPSMRSMLYTELSSARSKEEHVGIGGIGTEVWDGYEATGEAGNIDFNKGYLTTFEHVEKVVRLGFERKLIDDNQYGNQLQLRSQRLGISAMVKMEEDAATTFNNAFSSSFPGGDGVALCSDSHPNSADDSGSTQDNAIDLPLTAANISTARQLMMDFRDDKGNRLGITPDTILVPPELEDTALKAVNSVQDPDSANNTINPQNGRYNVVPWHYLTDSNNWFLMDNVWMSQSLIWYNRTPLEIMLIDQTTTHYVYEAYMRYSYGWEDWRWILGSQVA